MILVKIARVCDHPFIMILYGEDSIRACLNNDVDVKYYHLMFAKLKIHQLITG